MLLYLLQRYIKQGINLPAVWQVRQVRQDQDLVKKMGSAVALTVLVIAAAVGITNIVKDTKQQR
jgi:hypothetical protein